jgi:hypothetical protein
MIMATMSKLSNFLSISSFNFLLLALINLLDTVEGLNPKTSGIAQKRLHSTLGYCPPNEFEEVITRQSDMLTCSSNSNLICPNTGAQSS